MRTTTLLTTAAIALVMSGGAIAQSQRHDQRPGSVERIQDTNQQKAGEAQSQPQSTTPGAGRELNGRNVRTVYPNSNQSGAAQSQPAQSQATQQPAQNAPTQNAKDSAQRPAQSAQQPAQPSGPAQSPPPSSTAQGQQPSTTAQQPQQNPQPSATAQQPSPSQTAQPSQATPSNTQTTQQNAPSTQRSSSGVVALNAQQQTRIGQTISRHNVKPLTNVSFSIAVGTRVPASVQLRALPSDIVAFVPQYRGYSYVAVEEQIVIVEPATHEIVAIVPYTGATKTATRGRAMTSRSVSLDTGQRETIRRHVTRERRPSVSATVTTRKHYRVGERVPRTVTVEEFSEPVYREIPTVRRYRYFRDDDDVMLVDPDEDRIVDIIR